MAYVSLQYQANMLSKCEVMCIFLNRYILTYFRLTQVLAVFDLCRWPEAIPFPEKSAEAVTKALVRNIYYLSDITGIVGSHQIFDGIYVYAKKIM